MILRAKQHQMAPAITDHLQTCSPIENPRTVVREPKASSLGLLLPGSDIASKTLSFIGGPDPRFDLEAWPPVFLEPHSMQPG